MAASMNLLIVIVNYRTADLVVDCLASLEVDVATPDRSWKY